MYCLYCLIRFNVRGLNDEGNVANFVESEQILELLLLLQKYTLSFIAFLRVETCQKIAEETNQPIIPPYDDYNVIAGQVI